MKIDGIDVQFNAEGVALRGLLFRAGGGQGPTPCVVMAHGLAGEVSHFITDFAQAFAQAGITALVYDHRGWGHSDSALGTPRCESDPWQQIRDYQHAITYAQSLPEVDAECIGAWGSSYSAGHVFVLGAIDRRVKAVVGQIPFISGLQTFQGLVRIDHENANHEAFAADRRARAAGHAPAVLPVVSNDPQVPSALPTADAYEYFYGANGVITRDPGFPNQITLRSVEYSYGYEPGLYLPRISPTPLLMIVAAHDRLVRGELALRAYDSAAYPKKLVIVPGGHFDAYQGPAGELASRAACDWFAEHLLGIGKASKETCS